SFPDTVNDSSGLFTFYKWLDHLKINGTDYGTNEFNITNFYTFDISQTFSSIRAWALFGSGTSRGFLPVYKSIFIGTTGFGSSDLLNIPDCSAITLPGPFDGFQTGPNDGQVFVVA